MAGVNKDLTLLCDLDNNLWVQETTNKTFASEVLNSKNPVLVDFWAPWCGPCQQLSPIIDEIAKDFAGKIEVYKCNVDDNPKPPWEFVVRGIPALMIFKNGKLVDSKVGSLPKSALYEWVKSNL